MNCIVKEDHNIREMLLKRFTELKLLFVQVSDEAYGYGILLSQSQLTRYFKGDTKNIPKQSTIIWLCERYGISVHLNVKLEKYNDKKHKERAKRLASQTYEHNRRSGLDIHSGPSSEQEEREEIFP